MREARAGVSPTVKLQVLYILESAYGIYGIPLGRMISQQDLNLQEFRSACVRLEAHGKPWSLAQTQLTRSRAMAPKAEKSKVPQSGVMPMQLEYGV